MNSSWHGPLSRASHLRVRSLNGTSIFGPISLPKLGPDWYPNRMEATDLGGLTPLLSLLLKGDRKCINKLSWHEITWSICLSFYVHSCVDHRLKKAVFELNRSVVKIRRTDLKQWFKVRSSNTRPHDKTITDNFNDIFFLLFYDSSRSAIFLRFFKIFFSLRF